MTILEQIKARLAENDEWRGFAKYYPNYEIEIFSTKVTLHVINGDDYICWAIYDDIKRCILNCHLMTNFQADVVSIADMIQEIYADLRAENDQQD